MTHKAPADPNYLPVRLGTLRPDEVLGFDLFVFVANHWVKHTLHDDSLDPRRLTELKEKGIKKIYIAKMAEPAYLAFLDAGLNGLKNADGSPKAKAELAQSTLAGIAQDVSSVVTAEAFDATSARVRKINEFLFSEKNMVQEFIRSSGVSRDLAQHSATVSTLSMGLATKLGITDQKDLLELSIAALIHDVAKSGDDDWNKPEAEFSPEQKMRHLAHTEDAAALLANKAHVSPRILMLIRDHEELGNGEGFPSKKKFDALPPIQQVLNICNHYDRACARAQTSPIEAGKKFFIEKIGLFKLDVLTALSEVVGRPG